MYSMYLFAVCCGASGKLHTARKVVEIITVSLGMALPFYPVFRLWRIFIVKFLGFPSSLSNWRIMFRLQGGQRRWLPSPPPSHWSSPWHPAAVEFASASQACSPVEASLSLTPCHFTRHPFIVPPKSEPGMCFLFRLITNSTLLRSPSKMPWVDLLTVCDLHPINCTLGTGNPAVVNNACDTARVLSTLVGRGMHPSWMQNPGNQSKCRGFALQTTM